MTEDSFRILQPGAAMFHPIPERLPGGFSIPSRRISPRMIPEHSSGSFQHSNEFQCDVTVTLSRSWGGGGGSPISMSIICQSIPLQFQLSTAAIFSDLTHFDADVITLHDMGRRRSSGHRHHSHQHGDHQHGQHQRKHSFKSTYH